MIPSRGIHSYRQGDRTPYPDRGTEVNLDETQQAQRHSACPRRRLRLACCRSLRGRNACERQGEADASGAKPGKAKVEAKLPVASKSLKNEAAKARQLE